MDGSVGSRSTAKGTDVNRDRKFLLELDKYRAPAIGANIRSRRRTVSYAVAQELKRLDPEGLDVISRATRDRCKAEGLSLEHLGVTIGTVIHGVDLSQKLPKSTIEAIKEVLHERKVIFFRNQVLSREEHLSFGRRFGELEIHPFSKPLAGYPEILVIHHDKDAPATENVWHSDVTWRAEPSLGSILYMRGDAPLTGGDTLFCDSHCQYLGLPEDVKKKACGLTAQHDFRNFRMGLEKSGIPKDIIEKMTSHYPIARHPVIRTHPVTGKQGVYVSSNFTECIEGLSKEDGDKLLNTLYKQCGHPEYQCRFKWEKGSVAFWDNRACQHYASADYYPFSRVVERVTICGDVPFYQESGKLSSL